MPDDTNGNYSLVSSYKASPGQTITTVQHNPVLEDIAKALTARMSRDGRAPMTGNLPMGNFKITQLANGVASTDAATVGQTQSAMPIGSVIAFAGTSQPAGWIFCDGSLGERSNFPELFAVIGTTYGSTGPTNFRLPDLRGNIVAGRDNMGIGPAGRLTGTPGGVQGTTLGALGGEQQAGLTVGNLPSHSFSVSGSTNGVADHTHFHDTVFGISGGPFTGVVITTQGQAGGTTATSPSGAHSHTVSGSTNSLGSNTPHNNVQPTIILNYMIKFRH